MNFQTMRVNNIWTPKQNIGEIQGDTSCKGDLFEGHCHCMDGGREGAQEEVGREDPGQPLTS